MSDRDRRSPETPLGIPPASRVDNLLDWLYALRDRQRQLQRNGAWIIKGKDVPWEENDQGRMQWYLHPAIEGTAIRSMMFFRQEIAPGSRSGAQRTPGGQIIYVIKGRGYTMLDDDRHDWEAEDVINIPIRSEGVVVQHFNLDKEEPVVLIQAELNLADLLGLDRGSELEQVEKAPKG
jgi:gentisate 1,2-dioxygenase